MDNMGDVFLETDALSLEDEPDPESDWIRFLQQEEGAEEDWIRDLQDYNGRPSGWVRHSRQEHAQMNAYALILSMSTQRRIEWALKRHGEPCDQAERSAYVCTQARQIGRDALRDLFGVPKPITAGFVAKRVAATAAGAWDPRIGVLDTGRYVAGAASRFPNAWQTYTDASEVVDRHEEIVKSFEEDFGRDLTFEKACAA